jgi:hypothetical protein
MKRSFWLTTAARCNGSVVDLKNFRDYTGSFISRGTLKCGKLFDQVYNARQQ